MVQRSIDDPAYPTTAMKELFDAVLRIKSADEAAKFFRDLLTIAELKEFANRWHVVKLLHRGLTYEDIAKRLGVSTATVTRVAHWLHYGLGGYQIIANRVFRKK